MSTSTSPSQRDTASAPFMIEGQVQLEGKEACSGDLPLRAFAFGARGQFIGSSEVSADGAFAVAAQLKEPEAVSVLVGPAVDAALVRQAEPPTLHYKAGDWLKTDTGLVLRPQFVLPKPIWWPWWPIRICVRGRVRKAQDQRAPCPVPFAKVEVYDVDREGCLWPLLEPRLPHLFDRPVVRLPDLVKMPPIPDPIGPVAELARSLSPRVGEMRQLPDSVASRLQDLTVSSRIPPWLIWPRCYYSKALACQTETDCDGNFSCCFYWWPFHVRNGRLRFDTRPDILVRMTQEIDGATRTIYLDPYTSTRWDSWGAYLDLVLDDEDVVCGSGCSPQPEGTATQFVRVGNDEVYQINQASGEYDLTRPGLGGSVNHQAYGGGLNLHAVFGDTLSAAQAYYYRLSLMGPTTGGEWKDLKTRLTDTRVNKLTLFSESHDLGPVTVGATQNLYEVRNTAAYHWYNQDWIGTWYTDWAGDLDTHVPDQGLYTVRLEVFDAAGVKLTSASVDYRDGTVIPPAVLPPMLDACYLVMQIDNNRPTVALSFPPVVNDCGVVPIALAPFSITALVSQAHGRLHSWSLGYVKGLNIASGTLASQSSDTGLATPVAQAVSSAPMTNGLNGTCAFSLSVSAWAQVRNGYGLIYFSQQSYALAVDGCASA